MAGRSSSFLTEIGGVAGAVRVIGGCGSILVGGIVSLFMLIAALFAATARGASLTAALTPLGTAIGVALLSVAIATGFFWGLPRARRRAWLMEHGLRCRGRVRSIAQGALARQVHVTIEYVTPEGPRVGHAEHRYARRATRMTEGAEVEVVVDPDDPRVVAVVRI